MPSESERVILGGFWVIEDARVGTTSEESERCRSVLCGWGCSVGNGWTTSARSFSSCSADISTCAGSSDHVQSNPRPIVWIPHELPMLLLPGLSLSLEENGVDISVLLLFVLLLEKEEAGES